MADTLKVNFSAEEADSEARSFDPIPSGEYTVRVTDIEDKEITGTDPNTGQEKKNAGKHYWHMELTVQGGEHDGRKVWTNVMLFDGALYSLAQLLKATGNEKALSTGVIPAMSTFEGKEFNVIVKKQRDSYAEKRDGDGTPQWKNEVKGFKAAGAVKSAGGGKSGSGSLLP